VEAHGEEILVCPFLHWWAVNGKDGFGIGDLLSPFVSIGMYYRSFCSEWLVSWIFDLPI
jgi:hypothetical protein